MKFYFLYILLKKICLTNRNTTYNHHASRKLYIKDSDEYIDKQAEPVINTKVFKQDSNSCIRCLAPRIYTDFRIETILQDKETATFACQFSQPAKSCSIDMDLSKDKSDERDNKMFDLSTPCDGIDNNCLAGYHLNHVSDIPASDMPYKESGHISSFKRKTCHIDTCHDKKYKMSIQNFTNKVEFNVSDYQEIRLPYKDDDSTKKHKPMVIEEAVTFNRTIDLANKSSAISKPEGIYDDYTHIYQIVKIQNIFEAEKIEKMHNTSFESIPNNGMTNIIKPATSKIKKNRRKINSCQFLFTEISKNLYKNEEKYPQYGFKKTFGPSNSPFWAIYINKFVNSLPVYIEPEFYISNLKNIKHQVLYSQKNKTKLNDSTINLIKSDNKTPFKRDICDTKEFTKTYSAESLINEFKDKFQNFCW